MYQGTAVLPAARSESERIDPHPVYNAFMAMDAAQAFSRDEVRQTVIPAYMGLIKQIDDHIGRLLTELERSGRFQDTMIVFTSDHGDYLGDHWLGEKELFHEQSVRIPLLVYDPDPRANATRGTTEHRLVEAIDLVPTFLDSMAIPLPTHRLEGRSLLSLLRAQEAQPWRTAAFSELDYAFYRARLALDVGPADARCYMLRTERWKYIHYKGFRPQLFDLANDVDEFCDLGTSPGHAAVREELHRQLFDKLTDRRNRVALTDEEVIRRTDGAGALGIIISEW
jgi:arylsulfatase A-like enzyme